MEVVSRNDEVFFVLTNRHFPPGSGFFVPSAAESLLPDPRAECSLLPISDSVVASSLSPGQSANVRKILRPSKPPPVIQETKGTTVCVLFCEKSSLLFASRAAVPPKLPRTGNLLNPWCALEALNGDAGHVVHFLRTS